MGRSHWIVAAGLLAVLAAPALAADAPPGEALPPPPGAPATPPVEPGSVKGLQPVAPPPPTNSTMIAPTQNERILTSSRAFTGIPEYITPMYDPQGRYLIPWTGQHMWRDRWWTVFAAETITYDTNIFLSEDDEEDDWISNTSVGVTLRRQCGGWAALATVAATYSAYLEHDEENFLGANAIIDVGYNQGCGWYFGASDRFSYSDDPIIVRDDQFVVLEQEREDYIINDLEVRAGYHTPKWNAEVRYDIETYIGLDEVNEHYDYWAHGLRGRFDYYLSECFSLGAFAGVRYFDYTENELYDDPWIYEGGATFSWRPRAKLGVVGAVGYTWSEDGETNESILADIGVIWDATARTTFAAGWSHSFQPTFGAESEITDLIYLRGTHTIAPFWVFTVSTGLQMGDVQDPTLNSTKDYDLWFFDAFIHRNIGCHWGIDFGYQYRTQRADENGIDYTDHRITLGASFTL
jgi:hypothetical protein